MWRLAVLGLVGCSFDGPRPASSCGAGEELCGETCVAIATDVANCGACGAVCDGRCEEGACISACALSLSSRVQDAWGAWWDGIDRPPMPLSTAAAACSGFGARLPQASEMFRVRKTGQNPLSNNVAMPKLWSNAPEDPTLQVTVSLLDGGIFGADITMPQPYRCTCPAPLPEGSPLACHGPLQAGSHVSAGSAAYDRSPDAVKTLVGEGATGVDSLAGFVKAMTAPRHVWVMVPAGGPTESTVTELGNLLELGDTVIDGGNSFFKDDIRRAKAVAGKKIGYVDPARAAASTASNAACTIPSSSGCSSSSTAPRSGSRDRADSSQPRRSGRGDGGASGSSRTPTTRNPTTIASRSTRGGRRAPNLVALEPQTRRIAARPSSEL
ncbi:MAG TPA: NAD(P)-binding domain-containing protein [Kofleriaceae bacterium]|nr:NAD(P)-binding domain-containing protein [Kofleriaceae bacterium]